MDGAGVMLGEVPDFVKGVEAEEHGGGRGRATRVLGWYSGVCVCAGGVEAKHRQVGKAAVSREQSIAPNQWSTTPKVIRRANRSSSVGETQA